MTTVRSFDLSAFVAKLDIEITPWQRQWLERILRLPTRAITISGFRSGRTTSREAWGHYNAYQRYLAARRRRLATMRTAYHARRR